MTNKLKGKSVFSVLFEISSNFSNSYFFQERSLSVYIIYIGVSKNVNPIGNRFDNFLVFFILCATNLINFSIDVCKKMTRLVDDIDVWRILNNLNSLNVNNLKKSHYRSLNMATTIWNIFLLFSLKREHADMWHLEHGKCWADRMAIHNVTQSSMCLCVSLPVYTEIFLNFDDC